MKRVGKIRRFVFGLGTLAIVLCACAILAGGCGWLAHPGETAAEGRRRHMRNLALDKQELMSDIDTVLLLDKPSKLSDKRIP
ncbi:MAG TPA: hypothetical protein VMX13_17695 [Sedimentisphaerales bacterium]|nr:hypothetical protein [Sedimentisphaerales bacterium]